MKFYSRYNPPPHAGTAPKGESMTQAHMANDCDLNEIMARAKRGVIPSVLFQQKSPWYGDFTDGLSYHEIKNVLIETEKAFMELDPKLRERFGNDAAQLIAFIDDEGNREEAIALGLIPEPSKEAKTGSSEPSPT